MLDKKISNIYNIILSIFLGIFVVFVIYFFMNNKNIILLEQKDLHNLQSE